MVSISTAETELAAMGPCRSKLAAYSRRVAAAMSSVAGYIPNVTSPTHASVPVSYLCTLPNGTPWAIDTYQCRPSGSTAMPCGPSVSAG